MAFKKFSKMLFVVALLNAIVAVGFYFLGHLCVGLGWLGAYDNYVELEKADVMDLQKFSEFQSAHAYDWDGIMNPGDYILDPIFADGGFSGFINFAAILLAINSVIIFILSWRLRKTEERRCC